MIVNRMVVVIGERSIVVYRRNIETIVVYQRLASDKYRNITTFHIAAKDIVNIAYHCACEVWPKIDHRQSNGATSTEFDELWFVLQQFSEY